jgi:hypothetical protein
MANHIFNVYLHTDKVRFNEDYPLSDYASDLPGFYFTRNEFVSAKAQAEIPNSILACRGANIFNAIASLGGLSEEETLATLSTFNSLSAINAVMESKALVPATSVKYSDITDIVWLICCGIYHYD